MYVEAAARAAIFHAMSKPVVAIVGRSNVGKSALFNRLVGQRKAIVEDIPGITRDRLYATASWRSREFTVIDTGGMAWPAEAPVQEQVRRQAQRAVEEADVILLVVDARSGLLPDDRDVAEYLRASRRPVLIVANKVDHPQHTGAYEFYELGLGDVIPISALHGLGINDLLDQVVALLPEGEPDVVAEPAIQVAVVGRPNVGKSSLVNAFLGEERVIVDPAAGTTRDSIDTRLEVDGRGVVLVDTAGLRRRGKVAGTVDWYAQLRSERAAERADVAIVVSDASEGLTSEDLRVAQLAMVKGCATVVALNKWDIAQADLDDVKARAEARLRLRPEVLTVSAKTGRGVRRLLARSLDLADRAAARVATSELNRFLADLQAARQPPAVRGRRLKLLYMTQYATRPARFAVQVSDRSRLTRDYGFFLENRLRERYGLQGVPLVIEYHGR